MWPSLALGCRSGVFFWHVFWNSGFRSRYTATDGKRRGSGLVLKKAWRGPGLAGDAYVKAIQAAKVCLGLLSKGSRDLHTSRSAEIPSIGSVLCAELTEEHVAMYRPDEEAVFWRSVEECAEICFELLADESKLKAIAKAGRKRCLQSCYLNEPTAEKILATLKNRKMLSANCHRISKTALS